MRKHMGYVTKNCLHCGTEFTINRHVDIRGLGVYCSPKCHTEGNRKPKVKCVCLNPDCQKEFYLSPSKIKFGGGKHCSRECASKTQTQKKKHRCDYCGKDILVSPYWIKKKDVHFCSKSCASKFFAEKRKAECKPKPVIIKLIKTRTLKEKVKCVCGVCGKEFFVDTGRIKNGWGKFCSVQCTGINQRKEITQERIAKDKINRRLSRSIRESLKENKAGRHWEDLVGYTVCDLQKHLEKKFLPGMSWDNIEEWHIDHIIPQVEFNYTHPEDVHFKECWALKNLQPLWAMDNIFKSATLIKNYQVSLNLREITL